MINPGGFLSGYLLSEIKEYQFKRQVKKELSIQSKQLLEMTYAYLVYISDKQEDQNQQIEGLLGAMSKYLSVF